MRILMVSDVYFPRVNGVSTSIETFRACLAAQGIEVRLVVPAYRGETGEPGIVRVPGRAVPRDPEDRLVSWSAMKTAVLTVAQDCDLVHIQTPFAAHYSGLAAARKLGIPAIATYHTLFEEYFQYYAPWLPARWLKAMARRVSRRQCNALDAIVVPSAAMAERLAAYGVVRPCHVLPTGIPVANFSRGDGAAFRQRHGIDAKRPVALFVGRVAHEKNIAFLLQAFARTLVVRPDALFLVTGEGPALEELRVRTAELGLAQAVRFLGYLDRGTELPDCYAAADAFVFASRTETQGLVLLEAMAAGVPVLALSAMGTTDILGPRRGCLVPPEDPEAFGLALAQYFSHPEGRDQLREEARNYALEWSDGAMAARLGNLYRQLATAPPATAALPVGV
jgi:glycosyltransferase involved in cell wall biosynthesis